MNTRHHSTRALAAILLLTPILNGAHLQWPAPRQDAAEFVAWVKDHAIHLDTLAYDRVDEGVLERLDEALKGKRVVFLGEPDHYIREKWDFRLILIRYLVHKHGFRHIGLEMGLSDGSRVDRFLQTGDRTHLRRVGLYGYKGAQRDDRDDKPSGMFARISRNLRKNREAFKAEEFWFAQQLRRIGAEAVSSQQPLRFFGFDIDTRPGGGYEDAEEILSQAPESAAVAELGRRLARVRGESIEQEVGRLGSVVDWIDESRARLEPQLGPAPYEELREVVLTLSESLRFASRIKDSPSQSEMIEAFREREKTMFRRFDGYLSRLGEQEKIILMGHNLHLSKDYRSVQFGPLSGGSPMWESIGTHVVRRLPGQVYSVWLLYQGGANGGHQCPRKECRIRLGRDRIETQLAQAGESYILPLQGAGGRESYLSSRRQFVLNARYGAGILPRQADAIFFVRTVSPPRGRD